MNTFETALEDTLTECSSIGTCRGAVYSDSWHLDNQVSVCTTAVCTNLGILSLTPEEIRLIQLAALVDVKLQRVFSGAPTRDSFIDGINYMAVLAHFFTPAPIYDETNEEPFDDLGAVFSRGQ